MDEIKADIKEIKNTLIETRDTQNLIQKDLEYHIKRTDHLEEMLVPIHHWRIGIKTIGKFLVAASLLFGVIFSAKKALSAERQVSPIMKVYNKIQKRVKCKVVIHSAWRSKAHNKRIGGAEHSYHLKNKALDISAKCLSHKKLAKIANKYGTVIRYKTHVHVDLRPKKLCMIKTHDGFDYCRK